MDPITQTIKDSFDVISIILVFAFVIFDVRYPKVIKMIEREPPPKERTEAIKDYRRDLRKTFITGSLPLNVTYLFLLYLFLPLFWEVLMLSEWKFWHFDFFRAAFIVVFIFLFIFLIWSCSLSYQLIRKRRYE